MKTIYTAGLYNMEIEDSGGTRFVFEYIKLTKTQAKEILTSMFFFGVRVVSINFKEV